MATKPLVVIVGPTASGKTGLAIELAQQYGGEIICADSRTVYKGMDIGTAKPTAAERAAVPHWGLDLVAPNESYSVAAFKEYALEKIAEIRGRGHVPFLVGGTGLYVDAIVFDYNFGSVVDGKRREALEGQTLEELQQYCKKNSIELPENYKNKRYVINTILQNGNVSKRRDSLIENCNIVGIATEKEELVSRIDLRTEQIFDDGVVEEAKSLADRYGWESEAMTGNVYRLCRRYLDGSLDLEQTKEKFKTADWRLAKRQLTWMKRNRFIKWQGLNETRQYLTQLLESEQ
jgi:tRNA dimethylallyltransferase